MPPSSSAPSPRRRLTDRPGAGGGAPVRHRRRGCGDDERRRRGLGARDAGLPAPAAAPPRRSTSGTVARPRRPARGAALRRAAPARLRAAELARAGRRGWCCSATTSRVPPQAPGPTRATAAARAGPPLVMVDQEGGEIRILPWAPRPRPGRATGRGTVGVAAEAAARALRSAGSTSPSRPWPTSPRPRTPRSRAGLLGRLRARRRGAARVRLGSRDGASRPPSSTSPASAARHQHRLRPGHHRAPHAAVPRGPGPLPGGDRGRLPLDGRPRAYPALDGNRIASQSRRWSGGCFAKTSASGAW